MAPKDAFYDKDMGYQRLMTQFLAGKEGQAVFVGCLQSSGMYVPKEQGQKPISMAQVAAIHEFGAPGAGIPERSFMRAAVSANQDKLKKLTEKLALEVLEGKRNQVSALGTLGETLKGFMKAMILKGLKPGLKKATIDAKGSSKPLVDTGQLINSINWEIVDDKGKGGSE